MTAVLPKPGLDLRKAFGFARDDVLKATNNKQEPYVYGSLGGDDVALVPAKPVVPMIAQTDIRRDYELALQLGTRAAWASFLNTYPNGGFYADLAKGQLEKAQSTAVNGSSDKSITTPSPKDEKSTQQVASLMRTDPATPKVDSITDINRLLLSELRRVGCYAGLVSGSWDVDAQRSLYLFNKSAGMKLDVKSPNIEALDAVRGKVARVCPLICNHGYQANGENCTKITCSSLEPFGPRSRRTA